MKNTPSILILVALALALHGPLRAAGASEVGGVTKDGTTRDATRAMGAGLLAGTLGFTAGFLFGASMESSSSYEYAGLEYGFLVGSAVGGIALPIGVHAGNGGRGNGLLVVGTSLAVAAAGWGLAAMTGEVFLLPITAVGQLVACTAVEMGTTPKPKTDKEPTISVAPTIIDGKPGIFVAGTF